VLVAQFEATAVALRGLRVRSQSRRPEEGIRATKSLCDEENRKSLVEFMSKDAGPMRWLNVFVEQPEQVFRYEKTVKGRGGRDRSV